MKLKLPSTTVRIAAGLVLVLAIIVAWIFATPALQGSAHRTEETEKLLNREIISEIDLRETPIDDAVAFMNRQLAERPRLAHLHVALWKEGVPPGWLHVDGPPDEPDGPVIPDTSREDNISLRISNCPFLEGLRYITQLAGYRFVINGETIHCVKWKERGAMGEMIERTLGKESSALLAVFKDASEVKGYLREKEGMMFYTGSGVRFSGRNRIVVRNLREQIEGSPLNFDPTLRERVTGWADWMKDRFDNLRNGPSVTTRLPLMPPAPPGPATGVPELDPPL